MSNPQPAPRTIGPNEQRIIDLWLSARRAYDAAQPYEHFIEQATRDLALFKASLAAGDAKATFDFQLAEVLDNSQRAGFRDYVQKVEQFRSDHRWVMETMVRGTTETNRFVSQTLALASGAVALGALAYMGEAKPTNNIDGMVATIWLSAAGFTLTLIASHVSTLLMRPVIVSFGNLADPSLPAEKRPVLIQKRERQIKWATWPPRILGYVAACCLLAAVYVGGQALRDKHATNNRPPQTAQENSNERSNH